MNKDQFDKLMDMLNQICFIMVVSFVFNMCSR